MNISQFNRMINLIILTMIQITVYSQTFMNLTILTNPISSQTNEELEMHGLSIDHEIVLIVF